MDRETWETLRPGVRLVSSSRTEAVVTECRGRFVVVAVALPGKRQVTATIRYASAAEWELDRSHPRIVMQGGFEVTRKDGTVEFDRGLLPNKLPEAYDGR